MHVQALVESIGYTGNNLNDKYLHVEKGAFHCYLRTNKASLADDYHTCFIYDYTGDPLPFVLALRKHTQVLIYAQDEHTRDQLLTQGFKETNSFTEVKIDLKKELDRLPHSDIDVILYQKTLPSNEQQIIEHYKNRFLDHIKTGTKDAKRNSFTWFDSQYCPKEFHITYLEDDVLYAIFRRERKPVGVTKLLLPVPDFDPQDEIQIEIEYTDVAIDLQRYALYKKLLEIGYRYAYASQYDFTSPVSHTREQERKIHILESGKDAASWEEDSRKTNPLVSNVWSIKRGENN